MKEIDEWQARTPEGFMFDRYHFEKHSFPRYWVNPNISKKNGLMLDCLHKSDEKMQCGLGAGIKHGKVEFWQVYREKK